jgi:hypothetical protein
MEEGKWRMVRVRLFEVSYRFGDLYNNCVSGGITAKNYEKEKNN